MEPSVEPEDPDVHEVDARRNGYLLADSLNRIDHVALGDGIERLAERASRCLEGSNTGTVWSSGICPPTADDHVDGVSPVAFTLAPGRSTCSNGPPSARNPREGRRTAPRRRRGRFSGRQRAARRREAPGRRLTPRLAATDRFAEMATLEPAPAASAGRRQLLREDEEGACDGGPAEQEKERDPDGLLHSLVIGIGTRSVSACHESGTAASRSCEKGASPPLEWPCGDLCAGPPRLRRPPARRGRVATARCSRRRRRSLPALTETSQVGADARPRGRGGGRLRRERRARPREPPRDRGAGRPVAPLKARRFDAAKIEAAARMWRNW